MIGSYYETRALSPISMGALDQNMVDMAASTIQTILSNAPQLVTVVPWATEDDTGNWVVSLTPEVRYALYSVDASILDNVTKATFGQPVGFVGVFDTVMRASPEDLFDGTPWEYFQSQAVFSERDTGEPPAIRFLYWGKLRDDVSSKGSASTLEAKVKAAKATLVYPVTLPIQGTPRGMPSTEFRTALAAQTRTVQPAAMTPATAPSAVSPAVVSTGPTDKPSGWGGLILLGAIGTVSGYIAYRIARGR